jgi:predicted dehydrogenase
VKRLAFIGLGAVVRNIHLPALRQLANRVTVVGGCDPAPAARAAAERQGMATFTGVQEMLERTSPELVTVASPPGLHREHVEAALSAGCHVFCEKPLADSMEDADAIVSRAAVARRHVVVNNEFPAMRIHRAARAAIDTVAFGSLRYLHAWHTNRPTPHTEAGWRGEMAQRLGLEFGIHVFDLVRYLFDATPVTVMAHMPRPDPQICWDAVQTVAMEFEDGRAASFSLDRLSKGPERYLDMRLDGERAAVHTSIGGQIRAALGMHTRVRRPFLDLRWIGGGRAVLQQGDHERVLAVDHRNPFASATAVHLGEFLDALERGTIPPASAADNRHSLALVFAAERSAVERRSVRIGRPSSAPQ